MSSGKLSLGFGGGEFFGGAGFASSFSSLPDGLAGASSSGRCSGLLLVSDMLEFLGQDLGQYPRTGVC